jgi:hypothetical protein
MVDRDELHRLVTAVRAKSRMTVVIHTGRDGQPAAVSFQGNAYGRLSGKTLYCQAAIEPMRLWLESEKLDRLLRKHRQLVWSDDPFVEALHERALRRLKATKIADRVFKSRKADADYRESERLLRMWA